MLVRASLGRTALHMACEAGSDGVVGYLIQEQADVNAITLSGMTPLHFACREAKEMCVRALLHQNLELVDLDVDIAALMPHGGGGGVSANFRRLVLGYMDSSIATKGSFCMDFRDLQD